MNRKEQISDTAEHFYLNNEQNNYDDERLSKAFIRGAEWADANPFACDDMQQKAFDSFCNCICGGKRDIERYPECKTCKLYYEFETLLKDERS